MCAGSGDRAGTPLAVNRKWEPATLASDPSTEAGGYTAGTDPAAWRAFPLSPLEPSKAINAPPGQARVVTAKYYG